MSPAPFADESDTCHPSGQVVETTRECVEAVCFVNINPYPAQFMLSKTYRTVFMAGKLTHQRLFRKDP